MTKWEQSLWEEANSLSYGYTNSKQEVFICHLPFIWAIIQKAPQFMYGRFYGYPFIKYKIVNKLKWVQ